MLRQELVDELERSLEGMLDSLDLCLRDDPTNPLKYNSLARGVVQGFFYGEKKRAEELLLKIKTAKQNARTAQESADQLK